MRKQEELLYDQRKVITDKAEFERFLWLLLQDYKDNVESWENANLKDFIEAILAYTEDLEGYYKNNNIKHDFKQSAL